MAIDMTGKKYNRLTVLKPDTKKTPNQYWICQCECGTIKSIRGDHIRHGRTKSCGCLQKENYSKQGKINVQKIAGWNAIDVIGKKFGKLTVIDSHSTNKKTNTRMLVCKCECGSIINVYSTNLYRGHTTSCGCINSPGEEIISNILCEHGIKFTKNKTFDSCRMPSGAYAKFDFYINDEYLIECDGICHEKGWMRHMNDVKERDAIKDAWCKEHGITLLRVPYRKGQEIKFEDLIPKTSKYVVR